MSRRTSAGTTPVRVLLGIAGAFAITLVSWLLASSASAAEERPDPLAPLADLVGTTTEPVHEVVRQVTEVVVPPLRTDRIVAELTGTTPVFREPVRATGNTSTTRSSAPPPAAPERRATAKPRPPERQPVPVRITPPAPQAVKDVVAPVRLPEPAPEAAPDAPRLVEPRPDAPEPATPAPPASGVCTAPVHATDTAGACPPRPAPPPVPAGMAARPRPAFTEFIRADRPQVSPD
ncbi:hypothetical protein [Amycolatopsis thermoflava]|uniref:Uncharacterized protein n=1 Tax=Amycolatopsis thermoflava TaxID=84480 RepID=A0A3N2GWZ4_9PSEU|nr:hypothetical protein [Amycolatopsis thermoflava]ROS41107.1 hypothetical protein EDD35_3458 [Amycolatopsis thermoflava]